MNSPQIERSGCTAPRRTPLARGRIRGHCFRSGRGRSAVAGLIASLLLAAGVPDPAAARLPALPAGAAYGEYAVGVATGFAVDVRQRFDPWNTAYAGPEYRALLRRVEDAGQTRTVVFQLWYPRTTEHLPGTGRRAALSLPGAERAACELLRLLLPGGRSPGAADRRRRSGGVAAIRPPAGRRHPGRGGRRGATGNLRRDRPADPRRAARRMAGRLARRRQVPAHPPRPRARGQPCHVELARRIPRFPRLRGGGAHLHLRRRPAPRVPRRGLPFREAGVGRGGAAGLRGDSRPDQGRSLLLPPAVRARGPGGSRPPPASIRPRRRWCRGAWSAPPP